MVPRRRSTKRILGGLVPPRPQQPPRPPLGSRRSGSLGRHGEDLAPLTDPSPDFVRGFLTRHFFLPSAAAALTAPHADDIPRASTPTLAKPFSLDPHISRLKHHDDLSALARFHL